MIIHPLISKTKLGNLKLLKTYEYFDEPLLFSCKNEKEEIYIFTLTDDDYEKSERLWLGVLISESRLLMAEDNDLSLYHLYTLPENKLIVFVYASRVNNIEPNVQFVTASRVDDDLLPDKRAALTTILEKVDDDTIAEEKILSLKRIKPKYDLVAIEKMHQYSIASVPQQISQTSARLVFLSDDESIKLPLRSLGNFMRNFQDFVDLSVYTKKEVYGNDIRGRVPIGVMRESQLIFEQTFKRSLGIDVISESSKNDDTYLIESLNTLSQIMDMSLDEEYLSLTLKNINRRVVNKIRALYYIVSSINADFIFAWAQPNGRHRESFASSIDVSRALGVMNAQGDTVIESIKIIGYLVAGSIRTRRFEIEDLEKTVYAGKFSDTFNPNDQLLTLGERYISIILEIHQFDSTGQENISYLLNSLVKID